MNAPLISWFGFGHCNSHNYYGEWYIQDFVRKWELYFPLKVQNILIFLIARLGLQSAASAVTRSDTKML